MHLISKAQFATNLWQVSGVNKHKSVDALQFGKIKVNVLAVSFTNLVFVRL